MSRLSRRTVATGVAVTLASVAICLVPGHAQERANSDSLYRQLPWRFIGPEGNRVIGVAGVAGDPLVYYAGAASGGIWKTTDGGQLWVPVFDDQAGSRLAPSPSRRPMPNVVWAGTGETFRSRSNISIGNGVYKSTDAGRTWTQMGLEKTGRIARIVVDPANARHRRRVRARPRVRSAAGARASSAPPTAARTWDRVALRRREHRLLGRRDGPEEPAGAVRRHVAARNPHRGDPTAAARAAACSYRATAASRGSG